MTVAPVPHRLLREQPFVLIDRALAEDFPADWPAVEVAPQFVGLDTGRCPLLMDARRLNTQQQNDLLAFLEQETQHEKILYLSAFIAADIPFESLRQRLISRLVIYRTSSERVQFRYYDQRVFTHLRWMLNEQTFAAFMGPIQRWTYFLDGEWHTASPQPHAAEVFVLTKTDQERVARLAVINRVLVKLPEPANVKERQQLAQHMEKLISRAQTTYGLTDQDDLVQFTLHGMQVHARFDEHKRIQQLFAELREQKQLANNEGATYYDASALIDAPTWQKIRHELTAAAHPHNITKT